MRPYMAYTTMGSSTYEHQVRFIDRAGLTTRVVARDTRAPKLSESSSALSASAKWDLPDRHKVCG